MMKSSVCRAVFVTIAIGSFLFTVGCQDKLTHDNFSRIQQRASTQREVELTIGEPDQKIGTRWMWERPDKHLTAMIDYDEQGLVSRKQWIDGTTGTWEDTEPEKEGQSSSQTIRIEKR